MSRYPIYGKGNVLENISITGFRSALPHNWTAQRKENDLGVDLIVDIIDADGQARGLEFLVQLKSSAKLDRYEQGDFVKVKNFKISTYNHLMKKLQVVMIIKYIENLNELYWLLLKDAPQPDLDNKTFTINIPKANKMSEIEWPAIRQYVHEVQEKKLAANRN
jgi:hypothetical protein